MVFQTIEVLVAFAAVVATVGLVFFHAHGARIGGEGIRVDDRIGAIVVGVEFLGVVSVLRIG